jgi:hypothetical protein
LAPQQAYADLGRRVGHVDRGGPLQRLFISLRRRPPRRHAPSGPRFLVVVEVGCRGLGQGTEILKLVLVETCATVSGRPLRQTDLRPRDQENAGARHIFTPAGSPLKGHGDWSDLCHSVPRGRKPVGLVLRSAWASDGTVTAAVPVRGECSDEHNRAVQLACVHLTKAGPGAVQKGLIAGPCAPRSRL